MEPLRCPNLDRVYTIMGYQPVQIGLVGLVLFGGMQLGNGLGWGWWGIGGSFLAAFVVLRFSGLLRNNFPGRALIHLQKNIAMGQHYRPTRDRQHVPLVLDPYLIDD